VALQVEDDETPEMIMAKFAELERIQKVAEEKSKQVRPALVVPLACMEFPRPQTKYYLVEQGGQTFASCSPLTAHQPNERRKCWVFLDCPHRALLHPCLLPPARLQASAAAPSGGAGGSGSGSSEHTPAAPDAGSAAVAEPGAGPEQDLTDEQLMEVFKQASRCCS
jgi:hypothetical protein